MWKNALLQFTSFFLKPQTKDLSFTDMNDKEKQQILTFKKLDPAKV